MADASFLTPEDGRQRSVHQWSPPQHPDVTLYTPAQVPEGERAGAVTLDAQVPVWVTVQYAEIGVLHTHGFAVAASPTVMLVETTWQGRLQPVWVRREVVTRRGLRRSRERR
jgi:hypothetical protein